jgi:hypothetical protein
MLGIRIPPNLKEYGLHLAVLFHSDSHQHSKLHLPQSKDTNTTVFKCEQCHKHLGGMYIWWTKWDKSCGCWILMCGWIRAFNWKYSASCVLTTIFVRSWRTANSQTKRFRSDFGGCMWRLDIIHLFEGIVVGTKKGTVKLYKGMRDNKTTVLPGVRLGSGSKKGQWCPAVEEKYVQKLQRSRKGQIGS